MKIIIMFFLLLSLSMVKVDSHAEDLTGLRVVQDDTNISIRAADKIIKKYRTKDGRFQYRRWNVTKSCWVELNWINC